MMAPAAGFGGISNTGIVQMRNLGLRTRITAALALASAATATFMLLGAIWIIAGIVDRADQHELRANYDALQSKLDQESTGPPR